MQKQKSFTIGTFIRDEENNSGFITGIFENEFGKFYQLDGGGTIALFVPHNAIVSVATMTSVIKRPTRRRTHKKALGSTPTFNGDGKTHTETEERQAAGELA